MAYTLTLTYDEQKALAWVADRYTSAEILYDGMYALGDEKDGGTVTYTVPEHIAWEYDAALPLDNGNDGQIVPPCVGGTLAEKLIQLREGIV